MYMLGSVLKSLTTLATLVKSSSSSARTLSVSSLHLQFVKQPKALNIKQSAKMSQYETIQIGSDNSVTYGLFFKNKCGNLISPMHDIPLYANEEKTLYNMVVEVPRWTNAKMEISVQEPLNPIRQDTKRGKLRFVANCFPHKGYIWNYGALPQTWENPDHIEPTTGCKGDNDPIDVLEIGYRVAKRGEVIQVKVLGTVALIDEGETDWKIIAIDVKDPMAYQINDISDIELFYPGLLRATVEWFKIYKIPDGKPENQFAFNGDPKNAEFATNVIAETHKFWQDLICGSLRSEEVATANTTITDSENFLSPKKANKILAEAPASASVQEIDDIVDTWHYIHMK